MPESPEPNGAPQPPAAAQPIDEPVVVGDSLSNKGLGVFSEVFRGAVRSEKAFIKERLDEYKERQKAIKGLQKFLEQMDVVGEEFRAPLGWSGSLAELRRREAVHTASLIESERGAIERGQNPPPIEGRPSPVEEALASEDGLERLAGFLLAFDHSGRHPRLFHRMFLRVPEILLRSRPDGVAAVPRRADRHHVEFVGFHDAKRRAARSAPARDFCCFLLRELFRETEPAPSAYQGTVSWIRAVEFLARWDLKKCFDAKADEDFLIGVLRKAADRAERDLHETVPAFYNPEPVLGCRCGSEDKSQLKP